MWNVDPDIRRARTLPARFYTDPALFEASKERVFLRSWQLGGRAGDPSRARPFVLLPGFLDEPLLWTRDAAGALHCLSNVCTHRANLVCPEPCDAGELRCRYHGRRFALDGRFLHMPEFEGAEAFPGAEEDLPRVEHARLGPLLFCSLRPAQPFHAWIGPILERIGGLSLDALVPAPDRSRTYDVAAHWALYCENYLEGFHIPFVHGGLNALLDYGAYETVPLPGGVLQIGIAKPGETAFEPPGGGPGAPLRVAAWYAFLFPNLMLNFYPFGLSINVVEPLAPDRTRVRYETWVSDPSMLGKGAGGNLHAVEMEDEEVVEMVQRGVRSRLYRGGRYSPERERGVHHFHRMLAAAFC